MKILILMPLDEQHSYAAMGIYKYLSPETREITFPMPMYQDYMIQNKISNNWTEACYYSLVSAKSFCMAARADNKRYHNLVIIGNTDKQFEFDAVFNFQEIEESLPYKDNFIEHLLNNSLITSDPVLLRPIENLHTADESQLALRNCKATAEFIEAYLKTDPHIDEIRGKYDLEMFTKYLSKETLAMGSENKDDSTHKA